MRPSDYFGEYREYAQRQFSVLYRPSSIGRPKYKKQPRGPRPPTAGKTPGTYSLKMRALLPLLLEMNERGWSIRRIAAALGTTKNTVMFHLRATKPGEC